MPDFDRDRHGTQGRDAWSAEQDTDVVAIGHGQSCAWFDETGVPSHADIDGGAMPGVVRVVPVSAAT